MCGQKECFLYWPESGPTWQSDSGVEGLMYEVVWKGPPLRFLETSLPSPYLWEEEAIV